MSKKNFKLTIQYLGTCYNGWQYQPDCPTIQKEIESALKKILRKNKQNINLIASGRTDSGVHALGQVANIIIETNLSTNELKNAIEAVSRIPNPSIKIIFSETTNKVKCLIIDNGIGVDSNNIRKLFEPYYTTKEKGTGLGLSIVKKIIEDHNGTIKIEKNYKLSGSIVTVIFNTQ